jgi:hypothetical protein
MNKTQDNKEKTTYRRAKRGRASRTTKEGQDS